MSGEYELVLERSPTGAFCVELDDGTIAAFCGGYNLDDENVLVYRVAGVRNFMLYVRKMSYPRFKLCNGEAVSRNGLWFNGIQGRC